MIFKNLKTVITQNNRLTRTNQITYFSTKTLLGSIKNGAPDGSLHELLKNFSSMDALLLEEQIVKYLNSRVEN